MGDLNDNRLSLAVILGSTREGRFARPALAPAANPN